MPLLHEEIHQIAQVCMYNESHGVFGELLNPNIVLQALHYDNLEGRLDDPSLAQAVTALHSLLSPDQSVVYMEIDNCTAYPIILRYMNESGKVVDKWTIDATSTMLRDSQPGRLFILSTIQDNQESILGAYRTLKALPSAAPHCLLVQQNEEESNSFFVEVLLMDAYDSLMVAASELDPVMHPNTLKTIHTLTTIVRNVVEHPDESKFRALRLDNPQVHRAITKSPPAMMFLHVLGFVQHPKAPISGGAATEAHLVLELTKPSSILPQALELLESLQSRGSPSFVAELAPDVPWQTPVLTSSRYGTWTAQTGLHMLSPDERWAQSERFQFGRHRHSALPPR